MRPRNTFEAFASVERCDDFLAANRKERADPSGAAPDYGFQVEGCLLAGNGSDRLIETLGRTHQLGPVPTPERQRGGSSADRAGEEAQGDPAPRGVP